MTTLAIKDLATSKELDRTAMAGVSGGMGGFLNTDIDNLVNDLDLTFVTPTIQSNALAQSSAVFGSNSGNGVNYVDGRNTAFQSNHSDNDFDTYIDIYNR